MFGSRRSFVWLTLILPLVAILAGCSEDLDTGATCPILCPEQNVPLRDTIIDPVVAVDTAFPGVPLVGTEGSLILIDRTEAGETIRTGAVVRFDTLPQRFQPSRTDTTTAPIDTVIDARLQLNTIRDTIADLIPDSVRFVLYDLSDVPADDPLAVIPSFTDARIIGSTYVADTTLQDSTFSLPIPDALVLQRLRAGERLRIGFVARSDEGPVRLLVGSTEGATGGPRLVFRPSTDTTTITVAPLSRTPAGDVQRAFELEDYTVVLEGLDPPVAGALAVGGLPSYRVYMRFELPDSLLDAVTVVRATLLLTQRPAGGIAADDTLGILPFRVLASERVGDPVQAALLVRPLVGDPSFPGIDSLAVVPSDSGRVTLVLTPLVRFWARTEDDKTPPALVLRVNREGAEVRRALFFSSEAPESVRPKLRITYVPEVEFGLP